MIEVVDISGGWVMSFAEKLKSLMEERGLTAYALAKKSDVSTQTLSKLLQGAYGPSWDTVQKLAKALGVDCRAFAEEE